MAPSDSPTSPTRPDLIARFDSLAVEAGGFCKSLGLPTTYVSGLRAGRFGSVKGLESLRRFEAGIQVAESQRRTQALAPPPAPADELDPRVEALAEAFKAAETLAALDEVLKTTLELCALDVISDRKAAALEGLAKERRQVLIKLDEQRRSIDASKPLDVVVRWENSWEQKVKENLEASS